MRSQKRVWFSVVSGLLIPSLIGSFSLPDVCAAQELAKRKKLNQPQGQAAEQPAPKPDPKMVLIPSGTEVPVELSENVASSTHGTGSAVAAKIANDVSISGTVVFKAGTPVTAFVESAKKKGAVGSPGRIAVFLKSTNSIDGTNIALSGSKEVEGSNNQSTALVVTILCCILGLLMQGGDAVIPPGSQISGRTGQEVTITIEP